MLQSEKRDAVKVNRLGYLPCDTKTVFVRLDAPEQAFRVVDCGGNVVFSGELTNGIEDIASGERTATGDFSRLSTPGVYRVETDQLGFSCLFSIGEDVYEAAFRDVNRMFYLQRCGLQMEERFAGEFSHPACHTTPAREIGTGIVRDVSGGWHDAGDYGRYVAPAAKAVMDLLLAYAQAPSAFSRDTGIPKSAHGLPDVLEEARYELDWMLKMQRPDGGVNHKVTCSGFPGFVMPEEEHEELLLSPVSTCSTADFCGVMAFASRVYATFVPDFAEECLLAAGRAYTYLEETPFSCFYNPEGIVTGQYEDVSDADERYFAACAMFYATNEARYGDDARARYQPAFADGFGWEEMGGYGNALYWMAERKDPALLAEMERALIARADELILQSESDGYRSTLLHYRWGSNMYLLNNAMLLLMANDAVKNDAYIRLAGAHVDYLFGANPLSMSYVTGHGGDFPLHPHHRPSAARETPMPGMLAGGPDEYLQDDCAKENLAGLPPARCYIDALESYSTNEIAIYWNSPLVYVLARLNRC